MRKNSNPNQGFFKELKSNPKNENKKSQFDYSSPVVPKSTGSSAMNTPRRMSEFKQVSNPKSNLKEEHRAHRDYRKASK